MTNGHPFDIEPPKRTRSTRPAPRREKAAAAAPETSLDRGVAGFFAWLVAPGLYLALGFVLAAGFLLCLYNPAWGALEARWPHEVFGLENGLFVFGPEDAHVTALLLTALGCLVALFCRPGPARGAVAVFGAAGLAAAYGPSGGSDLWAPAWVPMLAIAAVGAALVARTGAQVEGRRRMLLAAGTVALAATLFFPAGGLAYASPGLDHLDAMTDGTDLAEIVATLPVAVGLALLAVGLAALVGLGGAWARWAAGALLLILALTVPVHSLLSGDGGWTERLAALARAEFRAPWVWLLPMGAGLADLMRPRRA